MKEWLKRSFKFQYEKNKIGKIGLKNAMSKIVVCFIHILIRIKRMLLWHAFFVQNTYNEQT